MNAEDLARQFHKSYEELAPQYGYNTRFTGKPWEEIPDNNRKLMIAVCEGVLKVAREQDERNRIVIADLQSAWDKQNKQIAELQEQVAGARESALREARGGRPKIICLCGSTKFIEQFAIKTWELELEGHIVLGCTLLPQWYCPVRDHFAESLGVKEQRDNHHLQKIDLADEILVLNVGGYIGESTRREIEYATAKKKPVSYLETLTQPVAPKGDGKNGS